MTEIDLTQLPKTSKEAKEIGSKWYFTGKLCKNGHIDKRQTEWRKCHTCYKNGLKKYYKKNKEIISIKSKEKYYEHHELSKEKSRKYYYKNKKKCLLRNKIYYLLNINAMKLYHKKRRIDNPELYNSYNRNRYIKKKQCDGYHTSSDILKLLELQRYKCINCLCCVRDKYHVDHIVPLSKGGSNWIENIQILCPLCNMIKSNKDPIEWAQEQGRLL